MSPTHIRHWFVSLGLACAVPACADHPDALVEGLSQELDEPAEADGDEEDGCEGIAEEPVFAAPDAFEFTPPEAVPYHVSVPDGFCERTVDLSLKLHGTWADDVTQVAQSATPWLKGHVRDLPPNVYTFRAWATSEFGLVHVAQQSFVVNELRTTTRGQPRVDSLTATGRIVRGGNRIEVTARASDPGGSIASIEFFDNGIEVSSAGRSTVTFKNKLSPFKVQVRVTDNQGHQTVKETIVRPPFDDDCSDDFCNG